MIQFISNQTERYTHAEGIRLALEGGCRWIQLRMKEAEKAEVIETGKVVRELCTAFHATFILDDHVDLVHAVGADGVHLGRLDMPVEEARRVLGPDKIIGGTANTLDDVERICREGADYIGCGPFRYTTTKKRLAPLLGFEGYRRILEGMRERGLSLPLVAIGGITREDVPALMATGVTGIAVSGTVLRAADPADEMAQLISTIHKTTIK